MALTDADGEVVERYEYGDYGTPEFYDADGGPLSGSLLGNPCLFTGQRYDVETGFYWCKTRYLDPQTGRFTTRDPIGLWGDPINLGNGYSYAGNNPWTLVDPFGLCGSCSQQGEDTDDDEEDKSWWEELIDAVKEWWKGLNTPGEENDARSLLPGGDVDMRDWDNEKNTFTDPDFTDKYLENSAMNPVYRAAFGNVNEVAQEARYAGMRDGAIGAGLYGLGKGAGQFVDEAAYGARGAGSAGWGSRNLPFKDSERLYGVNNTLDRMESGGPFPYAKDGSAFGNWEGRLPDGNYREYTVETPGASNRGTRRVVQDTNTGRTYYTDDHYETFVQIDPTRR